MWRIQSCISLIDLLKPKEDGPLARNRAQDKDIPLAGVNLFDRTQFTHMVSKSTAQPPARWATNTQAQHIILLTPSSTGSRSGGLEQQGGRQLDPNYMSECEPALENDVHQSTCSQIGLEAEAADHHAKGAAVVELYAKGVAAIDDSHMEEVSLEAGCSQASTLHFSS